MNSYFFNNNTNGLILTSYNILKFKLFNNNTND